jgi:hypothetical protein
MDHMMTVIFSIGYFFETDVLTRRTFRVTMRSLLLMKGN